ncbi:MAG: GtrA family protein [Patescibacteria group bacterium]|nr:GtrA family protein [Patescibacteria group bacterium]MDE2015450.1 GtrA family protein [Patescibacteria group bacterium]MDE2226934.1 GtrA family protein [Patescibacteria group bacterium]
MKKRDLKAAIVIGVSVGLLSQIIVTNIFVTATHPLRFGVFLFFSALAPCALFMAYLIGKKIHVVYQFAKFAAVGTLNSFIDIGVLNLEIFLSGHAAGIYYPIFKAVSFVFATTNSFIWNKYWTFNSGDTKATSEAAKFYIVAVVGWILNVGSATLVVDFISRPSSISANLWANVGALVGIAASFLWDFLAYKYLVFKKPSEHPSGQSMA